MPEATQYAISNRELLEMLIKSAGVREGRWMLMLTFGLSAGNFGPDEGNIMPGAVVVVQSVGIQRAPPEAPAALVIDAAEISGGGKKARS
jgi:hypothetical protein